MSESDRADTSRLRVPPHSIDAEESLLGAMLLSELAIANVTGVVTADDFLPSGAPALFDAIQALYGSGQGVDPVTVADELDQAGVLESVGGPATLVTLQARTPAITNALHYAKIVEEKSLLRRLITTANDVAELGYSPLDDIEKTIDSAESMMFASPSVATPTRCRRSLRCWTAASRTSRCSTSVATPSPAPPPATPTWTTSSPACSPAR